MIGKEHIEDLSDLELSRYILAQGQLLAGLQDAGSPDADLVESSLAFAQSVWVERMKSKWTDGVR